MSRREQPFFRSFREVRDQGERILSENLALDEFLAREYLPYARTTIKSWKTTEIMFRRYISPTFGAGNLRDIRRIEIQSWQNNMIKDGFSTGSVNRAFAALSALYSCAELLGYIPFGLSPCYKLASFPKARHEPFVAPQEKMNALARELKQSNNVAAKAILLLILTDARKSEIIRAKWSDVDWESKELRSPRDIPGQQRYIGLNDEACAILKDMQASCRGEWIFAGRKAERLNSEIFPFWDKVRKDVGLPQMRIEDLRYDNVE